MKTVYRNLDDVFAAANIESGASLSFHHHLRDGDAVFNAVAEMLLKRKTEHLSLFPSSVFPCHTGLLQLLEKGAVHNLTTNYISGSVARHLGMHGLSGTLTMQSHGGRARALIAKESKVDVAFIAAPAVDREGNVTGTLGKAACGSLGYGVEDAIHADRVVALTDTVLERIEAPQIPGKHIDEIVVVERIGAASGIMSGTTHPTEDPVGVKIARSAYTLIRTLGLIEDGFSFQTGAGGISLAVNAHMHRHLREHHVKAAFISGGITRYHVKMLEEGLVDRLYDVQCFDTDAIRSLRENERHIAISASDYANPDNPKRVIKDLGVVILGAAEVDLEFNVNVTTDSYNNIIGGSGGHSDTAEDAAVTIIVAPLLRGRTPLITNKVTTVTTPGKDVDCLVTERGIAINARRRDLIDRCRRNGVDVMTIQELMETAHAFSGVPKKKVYKGRAYGVVHDRRGEPLDRLYTKR